MDPQGDHCVARYPEKSGMPERHQSGIAYEQAQAHGKNGKNQYLGNNAKKVISGERSEEHTSELQSLMRISYAVFCLKKKKKTIEEKEKSTKIKDKRQNKNNKERIYISDML